MRIFRNLCFALQIPMRHDRRLKYNLEGRILEDLLGDGPTGFFVAFIHGKGYSGKELFFIEPNGAPEVSPEEVELMTYDENKRARIMGIVPPQGRRR